MGKISRRDLMKYSGMGYLVALVGSIPDNLWGGTTTTALSGEASSNIPVANPDLWFDGADLGSTGSQITTWVNKGTLGTNFDLLYNSSILHNNGSTTASAVTVQDVSGFKAAYFNGSGWPTLHFRGVVNAETTQSSYYFFDGGVSTATVNNRTIFWVYYTTQTYNTSSGFSAFGTYSRYTQQSQVGFGYNDRYMVNERSDGFPTNSSTGMFNPTRNSIAQAGHRQNTSNQISFWQNKSSSLNNSYSYSDGTSGPVSGSSTSTDSTVKIGGMGSMRSGHASNGYTLEVIVYGSALSDSEIALMRNFLGSKYGQSANS